MKFNCVNHIFTGFSRNFSFFLRTQDIVYENYFTHYLTRTMKGDCQKFLTARCKKDKLGFVEMSGGTV